MANNKISLQSLKVELQKGILEQDKAFLITELARPRYSPNHRIAVVFYYEREWGEGSLTMDELNSARG